MDGNKDFLVVALTVAGVALFVGGFHFFGEDLGVRGQHSEAMAALTPVEQGKRLARGCVPCHDLTDMRRAARVGPPLWGIVGQKAAAVVGYPYSRALLRAGQDGIRWDESSLDRYLANPKEFIPGNKMAFAGLQEPDQRMALIAFLKTLQDGRSGGVVPLIDQAIRFP
ncbi:MAG: hypothetical protein HQL76_15635 [Magnetococcales bacterium]|nr:hypothetical protein [Magnetococcales bacterium]